MDTAQELPVILKQSSANMQHNNGAIFFASYYIIFGASRLAMIKKQNSTDTRP
jgi:hypothetical protein